MKVFDVLSTMNPDALTSIQLETFSEPIAFGKVGAIKLNPKFDRFPSQPRFRHIQGFRYCRQMFLPRLVLA